MTNSRMLLLVAFPLWVMALLLPAGRANAGNVEEARAFHEKASAAFGLGHFAAAAENFERAFELKPDPAELYNAAQAHRLAGNKERALTLYQNYLRMYGTRGKRGEVESHIRELKAAIDGAQAKPADGPALPTGGPSPATTPASSGGRAEPVTPAPAPAPAPAATAIPAAPAPAAAPPVPASSQSPSAAQAPAPVPTLVTPPPAPNTTLATQPGPPPDDRPLTKKPWFWIVVGGGVAAAVAVLVIALSGTKDPVGSLGTVGP